MHIAMVMLIIFFYILPLWSIYHYTLTGKLSLHDEKRAIPCHPRDRKKYILHCLHCARKRESLGTRLGRSIYIAAFADSKKCFKFTLLIQAAVITSGHPIG